ncbi:MAG: carbonic anhydrase [Spirochaetales bacterium]
MRHYHTYDELIRNNTRWALDMLRRDTRYFETLAEYQKPPFLYIGCSDSRVPIDTLTQTEPGELFIHRNIANQVIRTDMNLLSAVEFAIETLQVRHIVVCGHYECGGVTGAYRDDLVGLKENWTSGIKDIVREHRAELDAIPNESDRLDRLTELNVLAQVQNLFKISGIERLIQAAGREPNSYYPRLHGWVLDIRSGLIKELDLPLEQWKAEGSVPANYQPF